MKKASKRPVKVRRKWVINPKTRVVKSKKVYVRRKERPRTFRIGNGEWEEGE